MFITAQTEIEGNRTLEQRLVSQLVAAVHWRVNGTLH